MRSLHSMALEGHAPRLFAKTSRSGIPVNAFAVTMIFPLLSFLALSSGTSVALTWFANLTQAAQIINYIIMCTVYLFFYRALAVQGIDRASLPYRGWGQPYAAALGLLGEVFIIAMYGYETFLPGRWDVGTFFSYYAMIFVALVTYGAWKIVKRTRVVRPADADLLWARPVIDAYERSFTTQPRGFWSDVAHMFTWGRTRHRPAAALVED